MGEHLAVRFGIGVAVKPAFRRARDDFGRSVHVSRMLEMDDMSQGASIINPRMLLSSLMRSDLQTGQAFFVTRTLLARFLLHRRADVPADAM